MQLIMSFHNKFPKISQINYQGVKAAKSFGTKNPESSNSKLILEMANSKQN